MMGGFANGNVLYIYICIHNAMYVCIRTKAHFGDYEVDFAYVLAIHMSKSLKGEMEIGGKERERESTCRNL
jgi:hypothetical protein